jgi:MoaA/NifB/PqqE/SkfB family radical SAM enzyme
MLGGINYKNGFVTSCPQQSDQLYVIKEHQFVEPSKIINSENFKKHRKELMSGVWSYGCHLCKEAEDIGSKSMRDDFSHIQDSRSLEHYNSETGEIDFSGLRHIELRFSNSCNMACLHCSDVYSSGWMSKLKHYVPDEEDKKYKLIQLTREFHKSGPDEDLSISISIEEMERIVDDLNANFPGIRKIDFAGGEVLYQKQFIPCLKKLASHPNADKIALTFHTNFNAKFKPEELSKALEPFEQSLIHISVDSGKNIYDYFRTGNWDTLVENITRFKKVNNFSKLDVVCTTSAYQIMDIRNVFESLISLDVSFINSSIVYTPRYMNPAIMMLKFKDNVLKDFKETYVMIDERLKVGLQTQKLQSAKRALQDIENYVINCDIVGEFEYESFLVYIQKTDNIWKQNFNNHFKKYQYVDSSIVRVTDL